MSAPTAQDIRDLHAAMVALEGKPVSQSREAAYQARISAQAAHIKELEARLAAMAPTRLRALPGGKERGA